MILCIFIMCLGLIGNIMVPIVIMKTKDMRNSTNIFLTNLSIADLLVLLICTPTVLVEVNTRPETWVLGEEMCKLVPFIELTVAHASVLTILAISFERYYAICEPLKGKFINTLKLINLILKTLSQAGYVCTKTRALLICMAAWIIAALFTSPILIMAKYSIDDHEATCFTQASSSYSQFFFLMTIVIFFNVPLIVLIILYAIIAKKLIMNDKIPKIRLSKPEYSLKARKQVVLMLGAVVLSFFFCLLPFRIFTLWIMIVSDETFFKMKIDTYYSTLYFCRIMCYLNSAINPILYNLMSSKFRRGFLKICVYNITKEKKRIPTFNTITTNSSYIAASSSTNQQNQQILNTKQYLLLSISLDDLRILKRKKKTAPLQISILDQKFYSSNSLNYPRHFQCEVKILTEHRNCLYKISNNKGRPKTKANVKIIIPNEKKDRKTAIPLLYKK
ncbi:unnamed protein product [Diamesa serratosioi]